jgi:hypothetical protein
MVSIVQVDPPSVVATTIPLPELPVPTAQQSLVEVHDTLESEETPAGSD